MDKLEPATASLAISKPVIESPAAELPIQLRDALVRLCAMGLGLLGFLYLRFCYLTSRFQVTEKAHLGATATYNSKRYGGTTQALTTFIPDYTRVDLFGGYQLTHNVEVSFNVLNLTDDTYYDAIYRSVTPFTYIAPGRSALLKVDIDF